VCIEGIPRDARVFGIDPLQALQLAILRARQMLDVSLANSNFPQQFRVRGLL
jgi:hypothetical protein